MDEKEIVVEDLVADEDDMVHQEQAAPPKEYDLMRCGQLRQDGNAAFKEQRFDEAIAHYSQAIDCCPPEERSELSVLYSNRAAARHRLAATSEDRQAVVDDCSRSLELNDAYLKPLLKRATVLRELGGEQLDQSLADYKRIVELDPTNGAARTAMGELSAEIESRNERLKQEMLGKLKDLGNLVLKPFGLSTDNFQLDQNPDTGGYSINFKS